MGNTPKDYLTHAIPPQSDPSFVPYVRTNVPYENKRRHSRFKMSEGTALNLGDPSTMVDQGASRNAQYVIEVEAPHKSRSK